MIIIEKVNPAELLQELTRMDLQKVENSELIELVAKAKLLHQMFSLRQELEPIELTMMSGFSFYLQQMKDELKRRGIEMITLSEMIRDYAPLISQVLQEYTFNELFQLCDSLEKIIQVKENKAYTCIKELVEAEIIRRGSTTGNA